MGRLIGLVGYKSTLYTIQQKISACIMGVKVMLFNQTSLVSHPDHRKKNGIVGYS